MDRLAISSKSVSIRAKSKAQLGCTAFAGNEAIGWPGL